MRRLSIIMLLILMLSSMSLVAADVALAPYTGIYGVNMASMLYQGGEVWEGKDLNGYTASKSEINYSNAHIIALGGVYNIPSNEMNKDSYYSLTVTCSNGFYFKSQSHPSSIRPFELKVIPRFENGSGDYTGTDSDSDPVVIQYSGQTVDIHYDSASTGSKMWFDLILVLPIDYEPTPNSNFIVADGRQYNLVQADDYTALVSIELKYGDKRTNIIIPFSGFYNGASSTGKLDNNVSLMFTPTGQAANMVIGNTASVPVGHIDFMMNVSSGTGYRNGESIGIFLSSSSDPTVCDRDGFLFRHSSVKANTAITDYNSIPYQVYVRGKENNGYKDTAGTGSITRTREFDGTDYLNASGNIVNGQGGISNFIRPEWRSPDPVTTEYEGIFSGNPIEYYEYHGDIEVAIDEPRSLMLEGSYTSTVYIHVVTDGTV